MLCIILYIYIIKFVLFESECCEPCPCIIRLKIFYANNNMYLGMVSINSFFTNYN